MLCRIILLTIITDIIITIVIFITTTVVVIVFVVVIIICSNINIVMTVISIISILGLGPTSHPSSLPKLGGQASFGCCCFCV